MVEVQGLYAQLTSYEEHTPADVLVPVSATGLDNATALDITITDPTNKTALDRGSDRKPLVAAALRHKVKLGTHKRALEEAGDQGLSFMKGPLVFETTGAMGEETQKLWKLIVEMEADQRIPGAPQSRREQGGSIYGQQTSSHPTGYKLSRWHMPGATRIHSSVDRDLPGSKQLNIVLCS